MGSNEQLRRRMETALEHIRKGEFAREWTAEQKAGYLNFVRLRSGLLEHPLQEPDGAVRSLLNRRSGDTATM